MDANVKRFLLRKHCCVKLDSFCGGSGESFFRESTRSFVNVQLDCLVSVAGWGGSSLSWCGDLRSRSYELFVSCVVVPSTCLGQSCTLAGASSLPVTQVTDRFGVVTAGNERAIRRKRGIVSSSFGVGVGIAGITWCPVGGVILGVIEQVYGVHFLGGGVIPGTEATAADGVAGGTRKTWSLMPSTVMEREFIGTRALWSLPVCRPAKLRERVVVGVMAADGWAS